MWRIAVEAVLNGLISPDHRGHQVVAKAEGETVALPVTICRQCRDEWTQGVYSVMPYPTVAIPDPTPHMEPLCRRCATFVVPHRTAFGRRTVQWIKLVLTVKRYAKNDWEIE